MSLTKVSFLFITLGLFMNLLEVKAQKQQDRQAILDMCGCYEITFNFAETFSPNPDYQFKENYRSKGLEWIFPIKDEDGHISLQHLLIVGDSMIIKHWRQDWIYENTDFHHFQTNRSWQHETLASSEVENQWTQKVYQVDDGPRYEGSAEWVHLKDRRFWENTTYAPLPRREFTQRDDYNIMKRRNRHEITDFGHVHEQDNQKILRTELSEELVAEEKGYSPYRQVEDDRCSLAVEWWNNHEPYWRDVVKVWEENVYGQNQNFRMKGKVDGKIMYQALFALQDELMSEKKYKPKKAQKAIRDVIKKYVVFE